MDTPPTTARRCDDEGMTTPKPRFDLDDTVTFNSREEEDVERKRLDDMDRRVSLELRRLERSAQQLRVQRDSIMSRKFAIRSASKPVAAEREPRVVT